MLTIKRISNYPAGTIIQNKTGYIHVKQPNGKWIGQGRLNYIKEHGHLSDDQRVYHIDGDRTNNSEENLVAITFSTTRFQLLPQRRIMFMPKLKPAPSAQKAAVAR